MSHHSGFEIRRRYSPRIPIKAHVIFLVDGHVEEGQIMNLTTPGCLIESGVPVQTGQPLQLELYLSGLKCPLSVTLAIVRWSEGKRFAVEFIGMHQSHQRILKAFLSQHAPDTFMEQ